jgi:hypothetical protein
VDQGAQLEVALTEKLRFKENEPVHATVIEPVYSFDRVVIPAGSKLEGTITGFQKPGKWKRIAAKLSGNFTPLRSPEIAFHTLVLAGGERIPISTYVVPGTERVAGAGKSSEIALRNSFISTAPKPKKEPLTDFLWGLSPYRPQHVPAGTHVAAVLTEPLNFGEIDFDSGALDALASELPSNSIVSIRLLTPMDSRVTPLGAPVEGWLARPLLSRDGRLLFPAGSRLQGKVTQVEPARGRHRHGQLAFTFTTIALPDSLLTTALPQDIDSRLIGIRVNHDMKNLRIGENDTTRIVESKKRFIAPAWAFIKAGTSLNSSADAFDKALLDAYRGKALKQIAGSGTESGFGLPASISGAMVPGVGIGLSFFGAARSLYSNFLGRGRDIILPENTTLEVRLNKRSNEITQ